MKDLSLHTDFDSLEREMLEVEQVHCPVKHHFGSGVYIREVFLPAGTLVLGHAHKEKHITIKAKCWFTMAARLAGLKRLVLS